MEKKQYKVVITQTERFQYDVEAKNKQEAEEIANERFDSGDEGDYDDHNLMVESEVV